MINTKGRASKFYRRAGILFAGVFLCLVLQPQLLLASTISQGFTTETSLPLGTVVSLSPDQTDQVVSASSFNEANLLGVVTTQDDGLITIDAPDSTVYVATSGFVEVLVSDLGGEISVGDPIAASPLRGIAMRATEENDFILGYALERYDGENSLQTEQVNREDGQTTEARVGTIGVTLDPKASDGITEDSPPLIFVGELIFGRRLSYIQLISALVIFVLVIVVVGSLLYGAIYSSIIAVGRNPLSKSLVQKDLIKAIVLSLLVVGAGFGAVLILINL